ncbi:MAG: hypothetical protein OYG31_02695 [Candidatus Kaiserbacteria bacterium]|nr:hypothetical protein [Candidatus Kaiserbacteria bacterium]
MREPRNPFSFRSTESIESRHTFLKIFGHTILDALPDDCLANKVTIFRSSPGGGKTSLFRIFAPESLVEISRDRSTHREIFGRLKRRGMIGDDGPPGTLGVYLRLYDYAAMEDADLADDQDCRYLFALIGTRLIIKALTGILKLKNASLENLDKITILKPPDRCITGVPLPCDGKTLYDWAAKTERDICGKINRFDAPHSGDRAEPLLDSIVDYLHVICHDNLLFDGSPAASAVLIMLDDLHELTSTQRKILLEKVINARVPAPVWIAERLEALQINEIIFGYGRESSVINLETHWDKGNTFERFAKLISEKRAQHASLDFDINIYNNLERSISSTYRQNFRKATKKIRERIKKYTRDTKAYDGWIKKQEEEKSDVSDYEDMISWRSLEVRIKRAENKKQYKLVDLPLETSHEDYSHELVPVAEFFTHREFGLPYYFGFTNISKMATYNVELFLKIAADMFDEIMSQRIKNQNDETLDATRQEEIVKGIAHGKC